MRKSTVPATPNIQVIERMFTLIDVLASREEAISLKEISERTGLHPSTTHRILNDLAVGRFVDRPEAGSYRLGMRLLELGNLVKGRLNIRDVAFQPMRELHKQIQQPVNLAYAKVTRLFMLNALSASDQGCRWFAQLEVGHLYI